MPTGLGELEGNPALQSDFLRHLLRVAAIGLLGGGAVRAGAGLLRNTNPRYNPPEPAKPIIVDMPYPTEEPVVGTPPVDAAKPKERSREVVPKDKTVKAAGLEDILPSWIYDRLPTFQAPLGNPDATSVSDVPARALAGIPLGGAAALGGYYLTDKILRSAERNKARGELEDAQKDYQKTIINRLASSRLPAKTAADTSASTDRNIERIKSALDNAYATIKKAEEPSQLGKTIMSLLFPGLGSGDPDLAAANMGIVGSLGALGGYAGYNYGRSDDASRAVRNQIKKIDQANANKPLAPLIGRLVPIHRSAPQPA